MIKDNICRYLTRFESNIFVITFMLSAYKIGNLYVGKHFKHINPSVDKIENDGC